MAGLIARLLMLLVLGCGMAAGADLEDLYQSRTIVTGEGETDRERGFGECLRHVLVKVSGDPRLNDDPRVAALAGQAAQLVSGFRYRDRMAGVQIHDEQGSRDRPFDLTVSFDPAKIDAALRSLGRQPWTAPRPVVVLFVGVRTGATTYLLAGDGDRGRDQREALAAASEPLGMPMMLPSSAALAEAELSFENLSSAEASILDGVANRTGGDLALVGSLIWSKEALGWIADWRLGSEGKQHRWRISGVSFDEAFRNAMGGAAQILSGNGEPD